MSSPLSSPTVRMTLWAMKPAVTSAMPISAVLMSGYAWVAPNFSAASRFHSTGSMTKMWRAPALTAPCSADMPTPPTPTTATSCPGRMSAVRTAEP